MSMTTNRRSFLFGASVAGFGVLVQGKRSLAWGVGPNDTLNIACIGVGGKGGGDTEHAARVGRVVAVCDIDQIRLDDMARKQKESKKYNDYRELLHALGDQVDAVIVSTPDHTHAPAAVMAMRMGKHVYCQKPLAHTVREARLMRETARQKGVCTQMGNQGTADSGFRLRGRAGPVRGNRRGEGSARLDQSPIQLLEAGAGHRRAIAGIGADSLARALGPVLGDRARAAVQPDLSPA